MAQHKLVKAKPIPKPNIMDLQQQFQAHCATIEALQLTIATQQQQQETLMARFRQEVLPIEHQYIQSVYDKITRLLSFTAKKSLGKYDREALFSWIEEEFDELFQHPFNEKLDLDALRKQFFAVNKVRDIEPAQDEVDDFRQHVIDQYGTDGDLSDKELVEMMIDPEKLFNTLNRLLREPQDDNGHDNANSASTHDTQERLDEAQQTLDCLLKSKEMNKLYKKLANILHPDREPEPAKKEEKHLLMVQLSKAKKNHDVWTILGMYHQYVDPTFHFSQTDMPAINAQLQNRIDALTAELAGITDPYSLPGMILEKFGGKTARSIDNKFKKHSAQLQQMIKAQTQQCSELRSIAMLKRYLAPRRAEFDFERQMMDYY
ncbi:hypothetical protein SJI19_12910 [Acerihabitans sp. TG2]|uniref:hypothetical protein n=1 Tax=Acerihabitans sp. TG2 TaxID=3096008 RepID=UPI002B226948|nr:hypothetical protein [Acerihabitans sp. TG2]MEA9391434.1 hypothetical protein [Acerihabitans sp. TG2]